ncbi:MAG: DUF6973 domain-containing protein [Bacteroidia bacterium]
MLTAIIVSNTIMVNAQTGKSFLKLSPPVKLWVITHPFAACKSAKLTEQALAMTKEVKNDIRLDGLENGGQVDAFRHAFWMALMAQKYSCQKAFRLGKAHEKGNIRDFRKGKLEEGELPDSISVAMDHFNNCIGVHIGYENRKATSAELAEIVIDRILSGEMMIIKKDKEGRFLNCQGEMIHTKDWRGFWNNNRCLVRSNMMYSGGK